jgi:uncharacterized protein (TIGR02145 family)/uncharacterized repeat protein (TIGR02543 family)
MKQYSVSLLFFWLILVTCNKPVSTDLFDQGVPQVAVLITASTQGSSTYKITISGPAMNTIGPQEYTGGQTIELYVPEGINRRFYFQRINSSQQLTDTGVTISDIGSGMNTIHVTMVKATTSPESCSVSYNENGNTGGKVPDTQRQIKGGIIKLDTNSGVLVKTEYAFRGWNSKPDGSGKDYLPGSNYTADSNLTLYAKWIKLLTYTITYNGNRNTSGKVPSGQTKTEGVVVTLAYNADTLARAGYNFVGWNTRDDGSGKDYAEGANFTSDSSVILYARWTQLQTYKITYFGNDSTGGTVPAVQTKIKGVDLLIASNTGNLEKTGYTFDGWCTSTDSTGKVYAKGSSYTENADLLLYAKWKPRTFTVTFDGNKNTKGAVPAPQIKIYGKALVLSDNTGNLEKTDYIFDGWSTSADGVGTDYSKGASYTDNADIVLYAKWKHKPYTVTFDGNKNTKGDVPAPQLKNYDEALVLAGNTGNLEKTGFVFDGWSTSADGVGKDYPKDACYTDNADVLLYAKWKSLTFTVTYDGNGNEKGAVPNSQTKVYGEPLTLAYNPGNLSKTGYSFGGWSTSADGSGTDYASGASYTTDANLTLHAKWVMLGTYTVDYSPNGSTSGTVPNTQTRTTDVPVTIEGNTGNLVLAGYVFDGWNTKSNGTGKDYIQGDHYTDGINITLFAKWKALPFVYIIYQGNGNTGGAVPATQTKIKGEDLTLASKGTLVRAGSTFTGWNTEADGSGTSYGEGAIFTGDYAVGLYAQWKSTITQGPTVTDYDGNVYETIIVGNKVWTKENLRTTRFNDGTLIPNVYDSSEWVNLTSLGCCYYNNYSDAAYQRKWGAIYNGYAVTSGNLAPAGWRVADTADWKQLINYLVANGFNYDGSLMDTKVSKSLASQNDWLPSSSSGTPGRDSLQNNTSSFSGLPAGLRYFGQYQNQRTAVYWWTSTPTYMIFITNSSVAPMIATDGLQQGYYVRLVKDL